MEDISRRQMMKGAAAAVGGGLLAGVGAPYAMMLDEGQDNSLPFRFNIYQTEGMVELAEEYGVDHDHAKEVVKTYVEDAYDDLLDRADIDSYVEVRTETDAVRMHDDYSSAAAFAEDWYDTLGFLDDTASHGNLLIHEHHFIDALGKGETGWDGPFNQVSVCGTSSDTSNGSIIGNGDQLFQLDQDEIAEDVAYRLYDEEDDTIRSIEPGPGRVPISAVHELGHNSCLHHHHGDARIEKEGDGRRVETSIMLGPYYGSEEAGEEVPEDKMTDDVYLTNRFSDRAVEEIVAQYMDGV